MHALVLFYIYEHTKFEMPSFTNYKDMIGAKDRHIQTYYTQTYSSEYFATPPVGEVKITKTSKSHDYCYYNLHL